MKKNIISYSLWGDKPIYWKGALSNIELAKKYFPGFICRFYIDSQCDPILIQTLKGDNVEIVLVGKDKEYQGMYWRFEASQEEDVDVFLSRDCDSRLSERESSAVNEWILSNKDFHIMRDHPYHTVPILGGMWGSKNGLTGKINLLKLIEDWRLKRHQDIVKVSGHRQHSINAYGDDQEFLRESVYPLVKDNAMEHSEFNLKFEGNIRQFPTIRSNYEFVGDVFDENEQRHPEYWKIIKIKIN
jgi:hypothetical protein